MNESLSYSFLHTERGIFYLKLQYPIVLKDVGASLLDIKLF